MKITEQKASGLWCPMAGAASNTGCLGSKCMMWVWSVVDGHGDMVKTDEEWVCEECNGTGRDKEDPEYRCLECEGKGGGFKYVQLGYCGLARG
jgi:DnaJ-class molecular chaperone